MYCPKCGKELPEGAYFCPNCGNSIISPPSPLQTEDSPGQDISATEQQVEQRNTAPASQQSRPPIPDEEVKCPKCGATGCIPQYKQNVSGGGYGCCQGVLGSLILGPLGLLCGACGRSVKTTNSLVWICPKCGHEFQARSKKDMKTGYVTCCCLIPAMYLLEAFIVLSAPDTGIPRDIGMAWYAFFMVLVGAVFYPLMWYGGVRKARVAYTDEEKQQLKMVTIISGVISLILALVPVAF